MRTEAFLEPTRPRLLAGEPAVRRLSVPLSAFAARLRLRFATTRSRRSRRRRRNSAASARRRSGGVRGGFKVAMRGINPVEALHEQERGQPCPRGHGCPRSSRATFRVLMQLKNRKGAFHEQHRQGTRSSHRESGAEDARTPDAGAWSADSAAPIWHADDNSSPSTAVGTP